MKKHWQKGEPRKNRTVTPVRIRCQYAGGYTYVGNFVWFPRENAWSLVNDEEGMWGDARMDGRFWLDV